ncbi:MAG TPA: PP2C family protein-serine/threonine phosphatase [Candidatus Ozemobacteraceae bacterium]|nr:PP2C family protein-serine/threonine phosphatase [Candidatus Ozemobacteraceae bacterium]
MNRLQTDLVYRYAEAERELVRLNGELVKKQARLDADLRAAAEIQRALLPMPLPAFSPVQAAWEFIPSESVGGDIFMVRPLGERYLQVAILDISGHGVPSAMVTVSISQALQPHRGLVMQKNGSGEYRVTPPDNVLDELELEFPFSRFKKTFSIVYGILDKESGEFVFSNAGHPYPILVSGSEKPRYLEEHGAILGMGLGGSFPATSIFLKPGDRLFFYTDGLTECRNSEKEFFGEGRPIDLADTTRNLPLGDAVKKIHASAEAFIRECGFQDDFTLLALEYSGKLQAG